MHHGSLFHIRISMCFNYFLINPNSPDNKGSWRTLKDLYCSVTMLRELGLMTQWKELKLPQVGFRTSLLILQKQGCILPMVYNSFKRNMLHTNKPGCLNTASGKKHTGVGGGGGAENDYERISKKKDRHIRGCAPEANLHSPNWISLLGMLD